MSCSRKIATAAIAATVICVGLHAYSKFVVPALRERRINRLIREFELRPSRQTTSRLTSLVDNRIATQQQGKRILVALLTPEVFTRSSYRLGQPASFAYKKKTHVAFPESTFDYERKVHFDGDHWGGSSHGGNAINDEIRLEWLRPTPATPGTYTVKLEFTCKVTPPHSESKWRWNTKAPFPYNLLRARQTRYWRDPNDKPLYACNFTVPVTLDIVPEEDAEKVSLLSNPQLDAKMKTTFSISTQQGEFTYGNPTKGTRRKCTGPFSIRYQDSPANIAFTASFRDPNGYEYKRDDQVTPRLIALKGSSGTLWVAAGDFRIYQTGTHKGTVLLRPNLELAYRDPRIKTIWGGTLEFPVTIEVMQK